MQRSGFRARASTMMLHVVAPRTKSSRNNITGAAQVLAAAARRADTNTRRSRSSICPANGALSSASSPSSVNFASWLAANTPGRALPMADESAALATRPEFDIEAISLAAAAADCTTVAFVPSNTSRRAPHSRATARTAADLPQPPAPCSSSPRAHSTRMCRKAAP